MALNSWPFHPPWGARVNDSINPYKFTLQYIQVDQVIVISASHLTLYFNFVWLVCFYAIEDTFRIYERSELRQKLHFITYDRDSDSKSYNMVGNLPHTKLLFLQRKNALHISKRMGTNLMALVKNYSSKPQHRLSNPSITMLLLLPLFFHP